MAPQASTLTSCPARNSSSLLPSLVPANTQISDIPIPPGRHHAPADDLRVGIADERGGEHVRLIVPELGQGHHPGLLSFPADEKALGGCLASGRDFFHIGPDGSAEPCPFSTFSDSNVATIGVRKALQSPLFRKIRSTKALGWEHTGGCTLFEHREEIEKMVV